MISAISDLVIADLKTTQLVRVVAFVFVVTS